MALKAYAVLEKCENTGTFRMRFAYDSLVGNHLLPHKTCPYLLADRSRVTVILYQERMSHPCAAKDGILKALKEWQPKPLLGLLNDAEVLRHISKSPPNQTIILTQAEVDS